MRLLRIACCIVLWSVQQAGFSQTVYWNVDSSLYNASVTKLAMADVTTLLEQHTHTTFTSDSNKTGLIILELKKEKPFYENISMDMPAAERGYQWTTSSSGTVTRLTLTAKTYKGFADGLYALLQQELGFQFYHPREQHYPTSTIHWGKAKPFSGTPVFDIAGFHLHTMHPLELTECLLDETHPNALEEVKEYIDWLARNGQNYFEFYLLESIQRDSWIRHAKAITDYAHSRGIYCGIELSLHMIQQKAFKLYEGKLNKADKLKQNVAWLAPAGFDVWNVELSNHEFKQGKAEEKAQLLEVLSEELQKRNIRLMSRAHVVQPEKMVSGEKQAAFEASLPEGHGVMVHTVMFYTLNDSIAPVYENKNLLHMRELMHRIKDHRTTWYYPESAYWVTFDNSVPMLLLPYLSARLEDIEYCAAQQIRGHVTFSSGWEWGYWLIDWSIARWSWNYYRDGKAEAKTATQYAAAISTTPGFTTYFDQAAALQETYIKDKALIKVMTAQTVTDEIPGKFNAEYHPRPEWSYKHIRNKAEMQELDFMQRQYLDPLNELVNLHQQLSLPDTSKLNPAEQDLLDGLQITALRAQHRYHTLRYLLAYRTARLAKTKPDPLASELIEAARIRHSGLKLVQQREAAYRYPVSRLASQRKDRTAYHFGYLFPVHELHFWEREEEQARKNKYRFLYKNIWSVARIIGLIN